ncbi:MAG: hypothetical protein VX223_06000 [Myxococcota bacterium]|nr:hypothetical protein [Myxococcota bacterium]
MAWYPAPVYSDVTADPNVPYASSHWIPIAWYPMSTIPVAVSPPVTRASTVPHKTRNPVASLCSITWLVDNLFFFNYGLFFRFPLPLNIVSLGIRAISPIKSISFFGSPEPKMPDAVLTSVPRLPVVTIGCFITGNKIVIYPFAIFVPSSVLPEKAWLRLLPPKAIDNFPIRTNNTFFPDEIITRALGIRIILMWMSVWVLSMDREGGQNSQRCSGQDGVYLHVDNAP